MTRPMIDVHGKHAYGVRPDNALNSDVSRKRDRSALVLELHTGSCSIERKASKHEPGLDEARKTHT